MFVKYLGRDPRDKVEVVPLTDETYVCLDWKVFVKKVTNVKGETINVYETMKFIDSFHFLPESLDKLVKNLPPQSIKYLDMHFVEAFGADKNSSPSRACIRIHTWTVLKNSKILSCRR